MSTKEEIVAAIQAALDTAAALDTVTPVTIKEVDVKESDGTEQVFTPTV